MDGFLTEVLFNTTRAGGALLFADTAFVSKPSFLFSLTP